MSQIVWAGAADALSTKIGLLGSRSQSSRCSDWSIRHASGDVKPGRITWAQADRCALARSDMPAIHLCNIHSDAAVSPRYSLCLSSQASTLLYPDGRRVTLAPDELVLLCSTDRVAWSLEREFTSYALIADETLLASACPNFRDLVGCKLAFPFGLERTIHSMISSIIKAFDKQRFAEEGDDLAYAAFSLMRFASAARGSLSDRMPSTGLDTRCREFKRYIEGHYNDPDLSIRSIADAFQLSTRYLQRALAQEGYTPSGFLEQVRLEVSAKILRERSGISVTDVAFDCGFNSSGYFATRFRQAFGKTPRDYRKEFLAGTLAAA